MTTHTGLKLDLLAAVDSLPAEKADLAASPIEIKDGDRNKGSKTKTGKSYLGIKINDWAKDTIWDRIWFSPNEYAAGFITENIIITVSIWNAFQMESKQLTAITILNAAGTTIDTIILPDTYLAGEQKTHNVTILESGPPTQNTTYTYTIAGENFALAITGLRIDKFNFLPNWQSGIEFFFSLVCAIEETPRRVEQRRLLQTKPLRKFTASFLEEQENAQCIINSVIRFGDKVVAIPFFPEIMRLSSTTITGETTLTVETDVSNCWQYQNQMKFVILLEVDEKSRRASVSEVKEVEEIDGQDITFTQVVNGTFTKAGCYLFPALLCVLKSFEPEADAPGVLRVNLEFEEVTLG